MSDIDFDELDRAVASVLGSDGKVAPATDAPQQPETPVGVRQDTPVAQPAPAATAVTSPVLPAQSLHAQPVKPVQRGRFLDMIHPTGDMTSRPGLSPSTRTVPQSANATFVSDVVAPAAPAPAPAPTPVTPVPTPVPAPVEEAAPPTDFFAASPDDSQPHKAPETPASPFIADAKVDKRPLGAFSGTDTAASNDIRSQLFEVEKDDNVVEAAPATEPVTPIPAASPTAKSDAPKPHFSLFRHKDSKTEPTPAKVSAPKKPARHEPVDKLPKHGKGTFIWVTVAVAVMLIGFGVGATLYVVVLK